MTDPTPTEKLADFTSSRPDDAIVTVEGRVDPADATITIGEIKPSLARMNELQRLVRTADGYLRIVEAEGHGRGNGPVARWCSEAEPYLKSND